MEKSPEEKMKTVIKKAVLSKKALVKNAVLDFSNLAKVVLKKDEAKDNLKDSGIGLEEESPSTSDAIKKVIVLISQFFFVKDVAMIFCIAGIFI